MQPQSHPELICVSQKQYRQEMHALDCGGSLFAKLMCCELRIRSFARSTGGHPIELQSGGLRPFVMARWVSIRGTHVPPTGDSTFDSKLRKVPLGHKLSTSRHTAPPIRYKHCCLEHMHYLLLIADGVSSRNPSATN